jgi:hypothetical protein
MTRRELVALAAIVLAAVGAFVGMCLADRL